MLVMFSPCFFFFSNPFCTYELQSTRPRPRPFGPCTLTCMQHTNPNELTLFRLVAPVISTHGLPASETRGHEMLRNWVSTRDHHPSYANSCRGKNKQTEETDQGEVGGVKKRSQ